MIGTSELADTADLLSYCQIYSAWLVGEVLLAAYRVLCTVSPSDKVLLS